MIRIFASLIDSLLKKLVHVFTISSFCIPPCIDLSRIYINEFIHIPCHCYKCQDFGHLAAKCQNAKHYAKCCKEGHASQKEHPCEKSICCVLCKSGNHPCYSIYCPKLLSGVKKNHNDPSLKAVSWNMNRNPRDKLPILKKTAEDNDIVCI